jgi:predicted ATPase
LNQLRLAFEEAARGYGALITLVGEPGIGKTSLCEQLVGFVSEHGGLALVGHCYEEGSFRVAYQPFVEAFETYLHTCNTEDLRGELAWVVPSLREPLKVDPRPHADLEDDRWRLLQACADLLHHAATTHPLLLVLEDLHDADRGTLDLLLYLARRLHNERLLVVCTYRDVEIDRAHSLSAVLIELHRTSGVGRIHLRGLSTDEILNLLSGTTQGSGSLPFAELVHRHTDGNPLFVHEMLRFVLDEGLVEQRAGGLRRVGEESLAGRIPEGLREVVRKRLSRLSQSAQHVLTVASVVGRQFQLDVLRLTLDCSEEELECALENASAAKIIEERSGMGAALTYRFSHAFFRQTLYDEIIAPRRIRLHAQVAHALENIHVHRLDEHADELAEHYAFSTTPIDVAKAVKYGEIAARRASGVCAYTDAARQLERALGLQALLERDDLQRTDLLLAFGDALLASGGADRVIDRVAQDALALAERLGDRSRACRACCLALDAFIAHGATSSPKLREYRVWAEKARDFADPDSTQRIHADLALANTWQAQNRTQHAHALRQEALALATRLGEPETLFRTAFWTMYASSPQHWIDGLHVAEECAQWPRQGVSARSLGVALWAAGCLQLAQGQRARAEELWREVEKLAERTQVPTLRLLIYQRDAILAVVEGRLEEALALLRIFVERADELGASIRGRVLGLLVLLSPALYLGREDLWLSAYNELVQLSGSAASSRVNIACRALCLAHVGQVQEATVLVQPLLGEVENSSTEDERGITELSTLLQAALALQDQRAASFIADRLTCVAGLATGDWIYTTMARHLGDAAKLGGNSPAARSYFAQALEAAGKIHFRPEAALSRLELAAVLLKEGKFADASEHLEKAIAELRDMNMLPALERAQTLHDIVRVHDEATRQSSDSAMLTAREREIAILIADGVTNRGIAEKLVITEGTVEVHVRHILTKLGFRSRAQVAGWVATNSSRVSE